MAAFEVHQGTVSRINGTGFKLDDHWVNISKYAKPDDVVMPSAGQTVKVSLDKAGFVRKIESCVNLPMSDGHANGQADGHASASDNTPNREAVITRLAVLNTATAILSSGSRPVDPADVVKLASLLESWALR